jgi:transposase InsO family protein
MTALGPLRARPEPRLKREGPRGERRARAATRVRRPKRPNKNDSCGACRLLRWRRLRENRREAKQKPSPTLTSEQDFASASFHATFLRQRLDAEEFAHLREAQIPIEQWRWEYNTQRPHSSLGHKTPAEFGIEARAAMKPEVHPITPEPLSRQWQTLILT